MKLFKIFVSLCLGVVMTFGIAGCNTDTPSDNLPGEGERNGSLYTLQEAYDNGWLTREDLMSIAYYHNGGRTDNEEIMPEDYAPQLKTPEVLSEKTQLKIKSTAAKEYREEYDITIAQYYGTYGDCVAVMTSMNYRDGGGPCIDVTLPVAGVKFCIGSRNPIVIWRETEKVLAGQLYTLQEAYDNSWLTQEDLMSIAYYHNGGRTDNEEIMGESFKPVDKLPESLSESINLSIRQTMLNSLNAEFDSRNFELEQVGISSYYGSYNGGFAISMYYSENGDGGYTLNCMEHMDRIADVKFCYSSYTKFHCTINSYYSYEIFSNEIMIWKQEECEDLPEEEESVGAFYSLGEAYDNGWLTQEDIMSIAYYNNRGRWYNEEIMPEDYVPQPKMPEVLRDETQLKIKSVAAKWLRENTDIKYAEADGIIINQYYGTYGDCVAVRLRDNYSGSAAIAFTTSIAGVKIFYGEPRLIRIWRETK